MDGGTTIVNPLFEERDDDPTTAQRSTTPAAAASFWAEEAQGAVGGEGEMASQIKHSSLCPPLTARAQAAAMAEFYGTSAKKPSPPTSPESRPSAAGSPSDKDGPLYRPGPRDSHRLA